VVDLARPVVTAFVALGANLGDSRTTIARAMDDISKSTGVTLVQRSSLYRSAPIDSSGPDYVNAVVEILTSLSAPALLAVLQEIETLAGRERPYRNAPRTLDLDILIFGDASIHSPELTVPHPRMFERAFVLLPLAEIAPDQVTSSQLAAVRLQSVKRM
jgi:2-amino-4-hydroxy-6-hydroxymethyldihydropteridine diphosphokinase